MAFRTPLFADAVLIISLTLAGPAVSHKFPERGESASASDSLSLDRLPEAVDARHGRAVAPANASELASIVAPAAAARTSAPAVFEIAVEGGVLHPEGAAPHRLLVLPQEPTKRVHRLHHTASLERARPPQSLVQGREWRRRARETLFEDSLRDLDVTHSGDADLGCFNDGGAGPTGCAWYAQCFPRGVEGKRGSASFGVCGASVTLSVFLSLAVVMVLLSTIVATRMHLQMREEEADLLRACSFEELPPLGGLDGSQAEELPVADTDSGNRASSAELED